MKRPELIVVADDDPAMRSLLGASLRRRGFEVVECGDGRDLLELIRTAAERARVPNLVVCDLRMPDVSGFDVLHWLGRSLPEVPVILITAFGDAQTHRRAKALGAVALLDKPFELEDLHDCVSEALNRGP